MHVVFLVGVLYVHTYIRMYVLTYVPCILDELNVISVRTCICAMYSVVCMCAYVCTVKYCIYYVCTVRTYVCIVCAVRILCVLQSTTSVCVLCVL